MFISPLTALERQWVKYPEWMDQNFKQKCIQPNALDITVDAISVINQFTAPPQSKPFTISESGKLMRSQTPMPLTRYNNLTADVWKLDVGKSYDVSSDFYVDIPEGVAAFIITRSTFVRNGCFLQSGLYDHGFQGNVGAVLFNLGGLTIIEPHTRIGQLVFVESQTTGVLYAGGYNTQPGVHWTENK